MNIPSSRQLDNCITANEMWLRADCLSVWLSLAVRHSFLLCRFLYLVWFFVQKLSRRFGQINVQI